MSAEHMKTPKVQDAMARVGQVMADKIAPIFKSGALVTVIVRFPDNDEADFFMTDRAETLEDLKHFLTRCEGRERVSHTTEKRS